MTRIVELKRDRARTHNTLGFSIREVEKTVNELQEKGFYLVCTEQKIDTRKTTGKCFLKMLSIFAEFERNIITTRREKSVAKSRANGVRLGRKPTIDKQRILQLRNEGMSPTVIAEKMGIHRASIYRLLKDDLEQFEGKRYWDSVGEVYRIDHHDNKQRIN